MSILQKDKLGLFGDLNDGDCSKMDVGGYFCWNCRQEIIMMSGEDHCEIKPHVKGEEEWDDEFYDDVAWHGKTYLIRQFSHTKGNLQVNS